MWFFITKQVGTACVLKWIVANQPFSKIPHILVLVLAWLGSMCAVQYLQLINWMLKKCRPLLPNDQLCPAKTIHKTFFVVIPKEGSLRNMHHLIWHWIENWPLQHSKIYFQVDVTNKRRMHLLILLLLQRPHLGNVQVLVWHDSTAEMETTFTQWPSASWSESQGESDKLFASMPGSSVKLPGIKIFRTGCRSDMIKRDILSHWG